MGYYQAVGFLELLIPFSDMLTVLEIKEITAWDWVLGYTKTVFEWVHNARTISSNQTKGEMLYGVLAAT